MVWHSGVRAAPLLLLPLLALVSVPAVAMNSKERAKAAAEVAEMFYHGYNSYLTYAYPADELMPLSCKGRVRGVTKSRGDIDDALGNFQLTLIDTLDTLLVLGNETEFLRGCKLVVDTVSFDTDIVVSTFEVNIRVLGGLLSAHALVMDMKKDPAKRAKHAFLRSYKRELLHMSVDLGDRLLRAFDTETGLPWSRINLRHGVDKTVRRNDATCTACAGTMIMEFAALSRYTKNPVYEDAARKALSYLWARRSVGSDLVGTTINITSGHWVRADAGVGAGIDSYYEYLLKAYVMLGDPVYLNIFNKHYSAIMQYLKRGPYLVDAHMDNPNGLARRYMDALQMFFPGLQVLKGDLAAAIETHGMYYELIQKHALIPESFTHDFAVNWAQSPLRPELAESTYFLYRATGDPFYLDVGKHIMDNIQRHARVRCGFAAVSDVRSKLLEDKMDSFVLAETFKYLYLLFKDEDDVPIDLQKYVFTTEAHLLPLALAKVKLNLAPLHPQAEVYHVDSAAHDSSCLNPRTGSSSFFNVVMARHHSRMNCSIYDHHNINSARRQARNDNPSNGGWGSKPRQKITPSELDISNPSHVAYLTAVGISIDRSDPRNIRLVHQSVADNPLHEEGLAFMRGLIELSTARESPSNRKPIWVTIQSGQYTGQEYLGGPAMFGPIIASHLTQFSGQVVLATPSLACSPLTGDTHLLRAKIVVVQRGGCMFVEKVRHVEQHGALAVIVIDSNPPPQDRNYFTMSGDGKDDVRIPAVFLYKDDGDALLQAVAQGPVEVVLWGVSGEAGN